MWREASKVIEIIIIIIKLPIYANEKLGMGRPSASKCKWPEAFKQTVVL